MNPGDTPLTPKERVERIIPLSAFGQWMGVRVTRCTAGEVEIEVPVRPEHLQRHGFAHGAIVGYVADTACAWAAASTEGNVVTAEYKLNFLAPAVGQKLIGRGVTIKASKRQLVTRADVYAVNDGQERIVATALATIVRVTEQEP